MYAPEANFGQIPIAESSANSGSDPCERLTSNSLRNERSGSILPYRDLGCRLLCVFPGASHELIDAVLLFLLRPTKLQLA